MSAASLIIGVAVLLGLYMAWTIGANDAANSMADAVGSKSISIGWALFAAGICEFAGAVLVGSHVTDTVRKGIVSPEAIAQIPHLQQGDAAALLVIGMASVLLAAAVWLHIATWMGMPVSTTHSIVGAVAGFGVVAAGWHAVEWGTIGEIVASWFISPIVGGVLAFIIFRLISRFILGREKPTKAAVAIMPFIVCFIVIVVTLATLYKGLGNITEKADWITGPRALMLSLGMGFCAAWLSRILVARRLGRYHDSSLAVQLEQVERGFAPLVILTSCTIAFAHGANDVANAVGPLAAVVDIVRSGKVSMQVNVPSWVLALGGCGIAIGLGTFGYRVLHTVGERITQLTPSRGVAADVAACTTVLVCTRMKLPVSTTHTLVGAILGIGLARGLGAVNRQVIKNIFGSWLITVPAAAVLAVVFFFVGKVFLLDTMRGVLLSAAGAG